jgi:cytochrome c oxidase cbb3-type subunit 3
MRKALLLLVALAACDRPPSGEGIREWTPQDHDQLEQKARLAAGQQAAPEKDAEATGNRTLVEVTWRNQCAQCHGPLGRGDGPNGPMLKATDLTKDDWQAKTTDPEIAASIREGKGRMPKFDLPEPVVAGLVARIRAVRNK